MYSLEKKLKRSEIREIRENKNMTKVHLELPRFRLDSEIIFVKPLKELSLGRMFRGDAQLEGISDRPLMVTDAVQKAFIEVDESGSKASARVSVVEDSKKGEARRPLKSKQRPVPFVADQAKCAWIDSNCFHT